MEAESLDVLHGRRVNDEFTGDTQCHHAIVDTALEDTQAVGILLLVGEQTPEPGQLIRVFLLTEA